jgi:uncharacterized membrane protein
MRAAFRIVLALGMVSIGAMHFIKPDGFVKIVPSFLPNPLLLVYISGVFEILFGVGLLFPKTRRLASIGLILLYIAVFPANINMAINDIPMDGKPVPKALLWGRLPLQLVLIAWAYWVGRGPRDSGAEPEVRRKTPSP